MTLAAPRVGRGKLTLVVLVVAAVMAAGLALAGRVSADRERPEPTTAGTVTDYGHQELEITKCMQFRYTWTPAHVANITCTDLYGR